MSFSPILDRESTLIIVKSTREIEELMEERKTQSNYENRNNSHLIINNEQHIRKQNAVICFISHRQQPSNVIYDFTLQFQPFFICLTFQ